MPLADGHRAGRRGRLGDEPAGLAVGGEGQRRLDLGVLREALGPPGLDGAAGLVEPVEPLLRPPQPIGHAVGIAEEEGGRVDEHSASLLGLDLEPPVHRLRERLLDRPPLGRPVGERPVLVVRLDQQDLRPDPPERHDPRVAELPAVEPDRVRTQPARQRDLVQEFLVEPRDLHPELALGLVPVERG